MDILFYILLTVIPISLFFLSRYIYDHKFRGSYLPVVRKMLIYSQTPLYFLLLLSLIGYGLIIKFSLLAVYVIINQTLQYKAHLHNKSFKDKYIEECKEKLKHNPIINQI